MAQLIPDVRTNGTRKIDASAGCLPVVSAHVRCRQVFAGYTIVRFLGSGGMGEVYLGRHPHLPREDALKVLRPDMADAGFRQRFIREADLAAALSHPHIVSVYDRVSSRGSCGSPRSMSMAWMLRT